MADEDKSFFGNILDKIYNLIKGIPGEDTPIPDEITKEVWESIYDVLGKLIPFSNRRVLGHLVLLLRAIDKEFGTLLRELAPKYRDISDIFATLSESEEETASFIRLYSGKQQGQEIALEDVIQAEDRAERLLKEPAVDYRDRINELEEERKYIKLALKDRKLDPEKRKLLQRKSVEVHTELNQKLIETARDITYRNYLTARKEAIAQLHRDLAEKLERFKALEQRLAKLEQDKAVYQRIIDGKEPDWRTKYRLGGPGSGGGAGGAGSGSGTASLAAGGVAGAVVVGIIAYLLGEAAAAAVAAAIAAAAVISAAKAAIYIGTLLFAIAAFLKGDEGPLRKIVKDAQEAQKKKLEQPQDKKPEDGKKPGGKKRRRRRRVRTDFGDPNLPFDGIAANGAPQDLQGEQKIQVIMSFASDLPLQSNTRLRHKEETPEINVGRGYRVLG